MGFHRHHVFDADTGEHLGHRTTKYGAAKALADLWGCERQDLGVKKGRPIADEILRPDEATLNPDVRAAVILPSGHPDIVRFSR